MKMENDLKEERTRDLTVSFVVGAILVFVAYMSDMMANLFQPADDIQSFIVPLLVATTMVNLWISRARCSDSPTKLGLAKLIELMDGKR